MYSIENMPNVIEIGYAGEKNFRKVEIDMTAWMEEMPNGVPSIVVVSPGASEDQAYIAGTTFENNILTWTLTDGDTGLKEGTGSIQIWLEEQDAYYGTINKRGKSVIVATRVEPSLNDPDAVAPAAQQTWIDQMTALKVATVNAAAAAEDAKTDAETAQGKAEDAQEAAETAQGKAEDAQEAAEAAQAAVVEFSSDSEAWARGTRDGVEVESTDPAYHDNSKYWKEQADASATSAAESADAAAAAALNLIDDTAGDGVTNKVWSANKLHDTMATKADLVGGLVPAAQLPSYVDDVIEYASLSDFPVTGDAGKIYVALDTDKTYRWSGTEYICIGGGLELGETSENAYRGDRGKIAYDHATDANRSTTAQTEGLYKFATTAEGHVASVSAVQKSDITALGIPGSDTTYNTFVGATSSTAGSNGLVPGPTTTERYKFLCGDGSWAIPDGGKMVVFDLDTVTNSGGSYTHTTTLSDVTHDMKAVLIEVSNSEAFGADIEVSTADGSITLSCDEVNGTSDVTVSCVFVANASTITSSEFDVLSNRIGSLSALETEDKSSLVSAVNELNEQIEILNNNAELKNITPNNVSDFFTPRSGITMSNLTVKSKNGVNYVSCWIKRNAAWPSTDALDIGTIQSDYITCVSVPIATFDFFGLFADNGAIILKPHNNIAANTNYDLVFCYPNNN